MYGSLRLEKIDELILMAVKRQESLFGECIWFARCGAVGLRPPVVPVSSNFLRDRPQSFLIFRNQLVHRLHQACVRLVFIRRAAGLSLPWQAQIISIFLVGYAKLGHSIGTTTSFCACHAYGSRLCASHTVVSGLAFRNLSQNTDGLVFVSGQLLQFKMGFKGLSALQRFVSKISNSGEAG